MAEAFGLIIDLVSVSVSVSEHPDLALIAGPLQPIAFITLLSGHMAITSVTLSAAELTSKDGIEASVN